MPSSALPMRLAMLLAVITEAYCRQVTRRTVTGQSGKNKWWLNPFQISGNTVAQVMESMSRARRLGAMSQKDVFWAGYDHHTHKHSSHGSPKNAYARLGPPTIHCREGGTTWGHKIP